MKKILACALAALLTLPFAYAQRPFYSGETLSDPNRHDGGLVPVVGVHNIQIMRANRVLINESDGYGWTYNHAPMLAYWGGRYWCEYLSDPRSEHVMPSHSLLCFSEDGYEWSFPRVVFPIYKIPDGTLKEGFPPAEDQYAVMHQRMGFYVSNEGRLLVLGYYGISLSPKDKPCDGKGIGRVVREIYADGTFGPIYFIRYNSAWNEKNTSYPPYTKSRDKGFVAACREILSNPLMTNQWAEESDRGDALITTPSVYQAMSWYHLEGAQSKVVALFKNALTMTSSDEGKTWDAPAERAAGFVNSNAKIWGQRLSDGTYATVYNPSEFRWPLALSLSRDGIEYTTLNLVHGEVPPIRYGGHYKSYGPQYVRGIVEGNGEAPDGDLHVVYSVGKEDIWTARIPVPVQTKALSHADDDFSEYSSLSDMNTWNIYSPRWAPVSLERVEGKASLTLKDRDPWDYAKVEKIIPESRELDVEFEIIPSKIGDGGLEVEFKNPEGQTCSRLEFTPDGVVRAKGGYRYAEVGRFEEGETLKLSVHLSTDGRKASYSINGGTPLERMFYAPVHSVSRIVFRTGETRYFPTVDTPTDPDDDLPQANDPAKESVWHICYLKTSSSK